MTNSQAWFLSVSSYVLGSGRLDEPWLTFTDCAPILVTTEASLRNVRQRCPEFAGLLMYKFRPNIVVDGEGEWLEDYWAEVVAGGATLLLTGGLRPLLFAQRRLRHGPNGGRQARHRSEEAHEGPESGQREQMVAHIWEIRLPRRGPKAAAGRWRHGQGDQAALGKMCVELASLGTYVPTDRFRLLRSTELE